MVRQLQNLTYAVDLAIGTRGGARHHSATVDEDGHYSFAVAL
jgi:hypothetical protein